jgi:ArsR family transcriptional regulator, virulence genes transcriptional regulator
LLNYEIKGINEMIDKNTEEKLFRMHAEVCRSLGSPTRLKILNSLRDGEKSVEKLTRLLGLKKANVSQHLGVLRQLGIVSTRRDGQNIYYSIANMKIVKAGDILREVLFEQLKEGGILARELIGQ